MHILFDLDGTLTDSREGITRCYQHALAELGRPVPAASALTSCVGPPLAACFQSLLGTADRETIERAVASYRRRFEDRGMFENALYPGVAGALTALAHDGHRLSVVTAKPRAYAERILQHFAMDRAFDGIYGPEMGQRLFDKADFVAAALRDAATPASISCMIGDRSDDIVAAKENGVHAVGATWGYGTRDELERSGADALVDSAGAFVSYVRAGAWVVSR